MKKPLAIALTLYALALSVSHAQGSLVLPQGATPTLQQALEADRICMLEAAFSSGAAYGQGAEEARKQATLSCAPTQTALAQWANRMNAAMGHPAGDANQAAPELTRIRQRSALWLDAALARCRLLQADTLGQCRAVHGL